MKITEYLKKNHFQRKGKWHLEHQKNCSCGSIKKNGRRNNEERDRILFRYPVIQINYTTLYQNFIIHMVDIKAIFVDELTCLILCF